MGFPWETIVSTEGSINITELYELVLRALVNSKFDKILWFPRKMSMLSRNGGLNIYELAMGEIK